MIQAGNMELAIKLEEVTPWGKNLQEHQQIFCLNSGDLDKKIACFADGASSFNCELTRLGKFVRSFDPMYHFGKQALEHRLKTVVAASEEYLNNIPVEQQDALKVIETERIRTAKKFLADYEEGLSQKRYINHAFPDKTAFADDAFDLGLSSHLLFLYEELDVFFHIAAIAEMLRICREVRIFPLINFYGNPSIRLGPVMEHFKAAHRIEFRMSTYGFGGVRSKMLVIKKEIQ